MKRKNKILLAGLGSCVALLGYTAASVFPNILYKRNYTPEEIAHLTVVAHRGGAALGPENTLVTIERGMVAGADMIEIDIHQTADGQLVVCHDQSIDRTTNGKGLIRELTLSEIRQYNIVDSTGAATDQKIPTLEEVLELVNGKVKLLVEIKRTGSIYQGIEQRYIDMVKAHQAESWIVTQSFNDTVLEELHAIAPEMRLEKLWVFKFAGLPEAMDVKLTGYSLDKYDYISSFNFFYYSVTQRMIDAIHERGKEVKIWTVGAPSETPHLDVDGVITNHPHLWR